MKPGLKLFLLPMLLCVAGCSAAAEPHSASQEERLASITIAQDADEPEQKILAELYSQALSRHGKRNEVVDIAAGEGWEAINERRVGMVIACTGDVVGRAQPELAEGLEKKFAEADAQPNSEDNQRATYEYAVHSLAGFLQVPDPSPAQGCSESEFKDLPQNIIPIYDAASLDRETRYAINKLGRYLDEQTLKDLAEKAESSSLEDAVREWLDAKLI